MPSDRSRLGRWLDGGVAALVVLDAVYLLTRNIWAQELGEWPISHSMRLAVYGSAAAGILGVVWATTRAPTRRARVAGRLVTLAATGLLTFMAVARVSKRIYPVRWMSRPGPTTGLRVWELGSEERAEWAVRVAMHRVTTQPTSDDPISIPSTWEFPSDVAVAVVRGGGDSVRVWARANDGTQRCDEVPAATGHAGPARSRAAASEEHVQPCAGMTPDSSLVFSHPARVTDAVSRVDSTRIGTLWSQYRGNAMKSASSAGPTDSSGWTGHVDGEVRSSFSIVGNVAIVGTHGSGTIAAFDVASGTRLWSHRVPNWVHQDAVSDGRIVVVGFGDNNKSFWGRAPSGVAAFELTTGRSLWTQFDESSVMTSPVVHGDTIIYASAAGVVRKRVLSTGALLAEKLLDGGVIMAPPASVGDTIVFTYEDAGACAMLISSLRTLWCRTFARGTLLEMGHAAASIDNGLVFMTGLVDLRGVSVSEFLGLPGSLRRRLAWSFVKSTDIPAGQRVQALRLSDGSLVWRTHVFPNLREVTGHAAGTAVLEGKVGAIVLPLADSIAGFDSGTGRILWTAGARGSRGPPFLRGGQVVLAGHDGVIEVRDALTGKLQCQHRRAVGYDRAGPAQAGNLLLFADLHGGVEAIPANRLLACSASDRS